MAGNATVPFGAEGKIPARTERYNTDKINTAGKEFDAAGDKAESKAKDFYKEQLEKPKEELYDEVNKNYAKGEGKFGHINNRDYKTTLRLAREADAYNNKPVDHMFSVGTRKTGGHKDMGTGYDKPNIETMETRAMDQAFNLDTNQKKLAQELQDAVNRKDLNAFKQLYEMLYNVPLDEMSAKFEMSKFVRQHEVMQLLQKDLTTFNAFFGRALSASTCVTLFNMLEDQPELVAYLSNTILGGPAPSLSAYTEGQVRKQLLTEKLGTSDFSKVSPMKKQKALNEVNAELLSLQQLNTMRLEKMSFYNQFHYKDAYDRGVDTSKISRQYWGS